MRTTYVLWMVFRDWDRVVDDFGNVVMLNEVPYMAALEFRFGTVDA